MGQNQLTLIISTRWTASGPQPHEPLGVDGGPGQVPLEGCGWGRWGGAQEGSALAAGGTPTPRSASLCQHLQLEEAPAGLSLL